MLDTLPLEIQLNILRHLLVPNKPIAIGPFIEDHGYALITFYIDGFKTSIQPRARCLLRRKCL